jgi:hypothetical protein
MASTRRRRKKQTQSRRKNRYPLEKRHELGLSATVRAAKKRAEK